VTVVGIKEMEDNIRELESQIGERTAAVPAHSANPAMMQEIEDLEERLEEKREKLNKLKSGNG